jgi:pyruvate carboxylase subunit A
MKKILVANRGEIALRVMRSARKMGIQTVAVFSEPDRYSPHVRFADEAVCIGPAPSSQSYLNMGKIIEVAKELNVDGIHPGYGFLSENAKFAQAVTDNGLIFIGPKPHAIRVMGSKLAAKEAVKKYDIPMVPGIDEAVDDPAVAMDIAKKIGFPDSHQSLRRWWWKRNAHCGKRGRAERTNAKSDQRGPVGFREMAPFS